MVPEDACGLGVRDLWGSKHFLEAPSSEGVTLNRKIVPAAGGRFYHHNRTKTTRHSLSHRYPRATDILLKTEPSASDTDPSQDPHDASRVAFAARGSRGQNYFERAPPSLSLVYLAAIFQRVGPAMTLSCAVFALWLTAADLTSAAMAINCTVHTALPECISDKIYTAIVATIGTTLAIVIGIFIVGVLLIRRQRSAPVSSNSAAEAERGTYYLVTVYIS